MADPQLKLRCSVAGFGNCDPCCGLCKYSPNETECQALSTCLKPIHCHLRRLKVNTKDLQFEWQLILCRVGKFELIDSECPSNLTVCPKHRAELGLRWQGSRTCQHPLHKPASKAKPERGINSNSSKEIYLQERMLVRLGSGICGMCRKLKKREKLDDVPVKLNEDGHVPSTQLTYEDGQVATIKSKKRKSQLQKTWTSPKRKALRTDDNEPVNRAELAVPVNPDPLNQEGDRTLEYSNTTPTSDHDPKADPTDVHKQLIAAQLEIARLQNEVRELKHARLSQDDGLVQYCTEIDDYDTLMAFCTATLY